MYPYFIRVFQYTVPKSSNPVLLGLPETSTKTLSGRGFRVVEPSETQFGDNWRIESI
eukprot:m.13399 g.13399  ORF g.13399 m.13399 type:complete len:57 (-) comp4653_c0_seq1:1167-1337(-)